MTLVDGRYCTLDYFKAYLIGTRTDPNNPTVFNGAVTGSPDDQVLDECLLQAEAIFDQMTGSGFDQQTYTLVQPFQVFVDGNGWLNLLARERGPVTAVTAIQVRIVAAAALTWTPITWDASDGILLPPFYAGDTYPRPESWRVLVFPANPLPGVGPGQIFVKWSYTGGFATIPDALTNLVARMSTWIYKLRDSPLGVTQSNMGNAIVALAMPDDIKAQIEFWKPVYG